MKDTQETIFWGHIVDVVRNRVFDGKIVVKGDKIADIVATEEPLKDVPYILPGFVDSHIHIESSMLLPHNFAQAVVKHGTIACVCDAHEIANVLGREGVEFMIEDGKQCDFYFFNGVPSCVPATSFETSGAELNSEDVEELLKNENITHLSEMMNYPGVISNDEEVIRKIELAHKYNKPIDGHAPMLKGDDLKIYSSYNISTDHECNSIEEAEEKLSNNIKIQIREGSAAKNFDTLLPLVEKYSDRLMFCSDDKHPDDLLQGHINQLVKKALQKGYPLIDVLK
ncbi:MAG: amidohydrolase family protein, partial [Bacteroidales bacterium]|nr:amidohydrolase family protein [Bacteroidales bacterium]MDY6403061.1 amidohydrolase family protein [Bacteroidales bacterium]